MSRMSSWFAVCQQLSMGVAVVFGPPRSGFIARHVDCIAARYEVPHLVATPEAETATSMTSLSSKTGTGNGRAGQTTTPEVENAHPLFTINVYPDRKQLGRAYVDFVRMFRWSTFGVVYSRPTGIITKQERFAEPTPSCVGSRMRSRLMHISLICIAWQKWLYYTIFVFPFGNIAIDAQMCNCLPRLDRLL